MMMDGASADIGNKDMTMDDACTKWGNVQYRRNCGGQITDEKQKRLETSAGADHAGNAGVGCGAKKNTSGSVSMGDLRTAMEGDPDLPEMLMPAAQKKMQKSKFSHISDMDYKKVDSYFVSYSSDGHKADEIVVIAVKDKADVDEAKESLTKHQQDRYNLLQSYEPKQVSRIQDGGWFFTKSSMQSLLSQAIMMMCGKRLKIP